MSRLRFVIFMIVLSLGVHSLSAKKEVISLKVKLSGGKSTVVPKKQREGAVAFLESTLNYQEFPEEVDFSDIVDPFYPEEEEVIVEVVEIQEVATPKPEIINPMDVMKRAGDALKAQVRGTLTAGGNTFITTADGSFIGVGKEIPITFKNKTFLVTVETVSDKSFTLLLDNVRRRVSILDAAR